MSNQEIAIRTAIATANETINEKLPQIAENAIRISVLAAVNDTDSRNEIAIIQQKNTYLCASVVRLRLDVARYETAIERLKN